MEWIDWESLVDWSLDKTSRTQHVVSHLVISWLQIGLSRVRMRVLSRLLSAQRGDIHVAAGRSSIVIRDSLTWRETPRTFSRDHLSSVYLCPVSRRACRDFRDVSTASRPRIFNRTLLRDAATDSIAGDHFGEAEAESASCRGGRKHLFSLLPFFLSLMCIVNVLDRVYRMSGNYHR